MKKTEKIKLFLKYPFKVINSGLNIYKEEYYRRLNKKSFNIDQLPTIDICELIPDLNESVNHYTYLEGTSLVPDIILLKALARRFNNCAYLEIGSWRGESLSNVHEVTKDCTSITLSEAEMREMKLDEAFIKVHGIFSKDLENLKTVEHNSLTFDFKELNKKFDLIFIDGDHSNEGVLSDTKNSFNIKNGEDAIIVWHDYGNSTENVRHSVLAAILNGVPGEFHKNLYHVSNTLCAVYLENKKFNTYATSFPTLPNKNFTIHVKANKM
jgi:Methyltransferase domain